MLKGPAHRIREREIATYSWVEDVDGLDGGLAGLFGPKDQVEPGCQVLRDIVRLEGVAV